MFNVSVRTNNLELQYICEIIEERHEQYEEYMANYGNAAVVGWHNFNDFRLKVANVLHKKNHLKSNKKYSFSFNANCWIGFREYIVWRSINENIDLDPYLMAIYYGYKEQVFKQLEARSISFTYSEFGPKKLN